MSESRSLPAAVRARQDGLDVSTDRAEFLATWCAADRPPAVLVEPDAAAATAIVTWAARATGSASGLWTSGCVVAVGAAAGELAFGYAMRTGRDFRQVRTWHEAGQVVTAAVAETSVVVVAIGADLEVGDGEDYGELLGVSRPDVQVGLIAARDLSSASWLMAKQLWLGSAVSGQRYQVLAAPYFFGVTSQSVGYLPDRDVSADTAAGRLLELSQVTRPEAAAAEAGPELLVLAAHGRADHMGFGDSALCGDVAAWSGLSTGAAAGPRVPQCAHGLGCFLTGPRVPVSRLPTDILVLYSCTSGHVGSDMYERDFNIALAAVEGPARAIVATSRPMADQGWEVPLITALIRAGMPVGTVAAILNQAYRERVGVPAAYLVIGDPDVRMAPGQAASVVADGRTVRVTEPGTAAIVALDADVDRCAGADLPADVGAFVLGAGARRFLVLWHPDELVAGTTVTLERGADQELAAEQARSRQAIDTLVTTAPGMLPTEVHGRIEKIRRLERSATVALQDAVAHPGRRARALAALRRTGDELTRLDGVLAGSVIGRSSSGKTFDLEDAWETFYVPVRDGSVPRYGEEICGCGRRLHTFSITGPLGLAPAEQWSCMQCGDVAYRRSHLPAVRWHGEEFADRDGSLSYSFAVPNTEQFEVSVAISLWMSPRYGGRPSATPSVATAVVPAGSTAELPVVLSLAGLVPHRYIVNAAVSRHGAMDVYRRFVQVRPGAANAEGRAGR
jgi:hypothetical protein